MGLDMGDTARATSGNAFSPFALRLSDFVARRDPASPIEPQGWSPGQGDISLSQGLQGAFDEDELQSERYVSPVTMIKATQKATIPKKRRSKVVQLSRHGLPYAPFPRGITKKLATSFARSSTKKRSTLNKSTVEAIVHAGNLFLEQLSEDLDSYAGHGRRRGIDETDVAMILQRYIEMEQSRQLAPNLG